ncbi:hypothetical protein UT300013_12790 [Paraclostridium sordellii]
MEKFISEMLRKYPKLRSFAKKSYQLSMIFIGKTLNLKGQKIDEYLGKSQCIYNNKNYFGYYDKSPWNKDNSKVLTMLVPFDDKHPEGNEYAKIGYFDNNLDEFIEIDTTNSWNLQQGCMLQWIEKNNNENIIYNKFINDKYSSIIYNMENKEKTIIDYPIYCISKDGKFGLSVDFSRLGRLRPGYGYSNVKDYSAGQLAPDNNGIWLVNLEENTSKLIISLKDIVSFNHDKTMDGVEHKFNHIEFNPSGNRFMFLHRWRNNGIGYSRLFTANIDGSELYCIADDIMVSHSCWKNDYQILSWARKKEIGDRYYLYTDKTDKFEIIGDGILTSDGHPSYSNDGRYILTDTYPDKFRIKSLIIYDTVENKKYDIAKYYAPFKYDGEVRCDFHPRWSSDNKYISFDSVHEGGRKQYVMDNPFYKDKK